MKLVSSLLSQLGISAHVVKQKSSTSIPKTYPSNSIQIDEYELILPRETTFKDLAKFISTNNDHETFFNEYYLVEMADSGSLELMEEFHQKLENFDNSTVLFGSITFPTLK